MLRIAVEPGALQRIGVGDQGIGALENARLEERVEALAAGAKRASQHGVAKIGDPLDAVTALQAHGGEVGADGGGRREHDRSAVLLDPAARGRGGVGKPGDAVVVGRHKAAQQALGEARQRAAVPGMGNVSDFAAASGSLVLRSNGYHSRLIAETRQVFVEAIGAGASGQVIRGKVEGQNDNGFAPVFRFHAVRSSIAMGIETTCFGS